MENIELRLKRVGCAQVSDNWLEGDGQDEVHYLVSIPGGVDPFNRLKKGSEFKIREGQTIEMDEHVWTIDWRSPDYRVSFWDTDSLSPDDVLGSFKA
jgi:hypothetical protein